MRSTGVPRGCCGLSGAVYFRGPVLDALTFPHAEHARMHYQSLACTNGEPQNEVYHSMLSGSLHTLSKMKYVRTHAATFSHLDAV